VRRLLSSQEGQARFASAMANQGLRSFFSLIEQYTTQAEPAFCGISTLVMVLNALSVDPRRTWKGPWRWYEESMLNCCLDLEEVKETGITINSFRCLALCQGLVADVVFADDDEDGSEGINRFRRAIQKPCVAPAQNDAGGDSSKDEILVVSYCRKVLGQTGSGHFSPIAAYDSASDSVLVLDTARFKYGAHWVSVPLLFDAMRPVDPDTNRSRGYILLSDHEHEYSVDIITDENIPSLLPSVLFRSQKKQDPVRQEYKEFLANNKKIKGETTLEQVISFWTKDGTEPKYIWQMMEPQFTPLQEDNAAAELVQSVRFLIEVLISKQAHKFPESCCDCRINFSRTLPLASKEAIYVVYLASLDEVRRNDIIFSAGNENHSTYHSTRTEAGSTEEYDGQDNALASTAKAQLAAEAELVRYAIDMSSDGDECSNYYY
jgi:glutathione gamma-glutamylcysteinyltransferase